MDGARGWECSGNLSCAVESLEAVDRQSFVGC